MQLSGMALFGAINPKLLNEIWPAKWIVAENRSNSDYGVYFYRKSFDLSEAPESFLVHVSADCRYKLYVNGEFVSEGPAAGDFFQWNFESVDLAPFLVAGSNQIAALVWNEGEDRPEYQISFRTVRSSDSCHHRSSDLRLRVRAAGMLRPNGEMSDHHDWP